MMTDTRTRWRITLNELCYRCKITSVTLDKWAMMGVFGPRYKERRDRGWHRNITRTQAQQAVIMRALLDAGVHPEIAAQTASKHEVNDKSSLVINDVTGVYLVIDRAGLDLP